MFAKELPWTEIETPALLLDLGTVRGNLETMAGRAREMSVALRPHFKAHKCIELAQLQVEAGAVGLTVATVAEALALTDAEIGDVLVANQIVQRNQIDTLARMASVARVRTLIDDSANLRSIASTAHAAGVVVGVMVEIDTGMERCGVRNHERARELALLATELDGVRFDGVSTYEGQCARIPDPAERAARTREAIDKLARVVEALRADAIEVPTVSAGATSTHATTGNHPLVTEIQPGAYLLMDLLKYGLLSDFRIALTIVGTVVSRRGDRCVLDCGVKAVSSWRKPPLLYDDLGTIASIDEEHLRFDARGPEPRIGQRVRVLPGHGPLTVNHLRPDPRDARERRH
ncbi:MAG TPA: alanine racemase [Solirubrobacterales bacterium]|nr:alanine racemase [Solirubrobacterales bacterium]